MCDWRFFSLISFTLHKTSHSTLYTLCDPFSDLAIQVLLGVWLCVVAALVYNFLQAIYKGAGFVRLKWVGGPHRNQQIGGIDEESLHFR